MYDRGRLRAPKSSNSRGNALRGLTGNDRLAIQWALDQGYSVPSKPDGCLWVIGIACGLFAAVVPGVLLLIFLVIKQRDYENELRQIRNKWVDAGKPGIAPDPDSPEAQEELGKLLGR